MKILFSSHKSLLCILLFFSANLFNAQGEFSFITKGSFWMGNGGSSNDFREVYVGDFCIGKCEVTKKKWDDVYSWALKNGYKFNDDPNLAAAAGKASDHPVQMVSWYNVVKWCNARSEKEGLKPFYYTDDAQMTVYRSGTANITNAQVKWTANGYRLPTEAEWEKAARGGLEKALYPWGDTISHDDANYYDSIKGIHHPDFDELPFPFTSPCGGGLSASGYKFPANGFGLYDVAGNVYEWCWDKYGNVNPADLNNPKGPDSTLLSRVYRGGSWNSEELFCQVGYRYNLKAMPSYSSERIGFRVVTTPRITSSMAKVVLPIGIAYRYAIKTNFGATKFTTDPDLPDGLTLNSSTGVIRGTPTKAGTYRVTITATKRQGGKAVKTVKATKVFVVK